MTKTEYQSVYDMVLESLENNCIDVVDTEGEDYIKIFDHGSKNYFKVSITLDK